MFKHKISIIGFVKIFSFLALLTVLFGNGCSGFKSSIFGSGDLGSKSGGVGSPQILSDEETVEVISGTRTVSVLNYKGVLDSMLKATGVMQPSQNTLTRFDERIGMMSETGAVTTVNSPMLHVVTVVAGEVCSDLYAQEIALTPASRRFFNSLSATTGTAAQILSDATVNDIVRRMARSFWQRNELAEELTAIKAGLQEVITASATTNVRLGSLYICSAVLSSVSAIEK